MEAHTPRRSYYLVTESALLCADINPRRETLGALSVLKAPAQRRARPLVLAESAMASEASEPPKEEPKPEPVRAAARVMHYLTIQLDLDSR